MMASRVYGLIVEHLLLNLRFPPSLDLFWLLVLAEHRKQCSANTLGVSISMISDQPFRLVGLRPPDLYHSV